MWKNNKSSILIQKLRYLEQDYLQLKHYIVHLKEAIIFYHRDA